MFSSFFLYNSNENQILTSVTVFNYSKLNKMCFEDGGQMSIYLLNIKQPTWAVKQNYSQVSISNKPDTRLVRSEHFMDIVGVVSIWSERVELDRNSFAVGIPARCGFYSGSILAY